MHSAETIDALSVRLAEVYKPISISYNKHSNKFLMQLPWGVINVPVLRNGANFSVEIDKDLPQEEV